MVLTQHTVKVRQDRKEDRIQLATQTSTCISGVSEKENLAGRDIISAAYPGIPCFSSPEQLPLVLLVLLDKTRDRTTFCLVQ